MPRPAVLVFAGFLLLASGCATYPMGLTKSEWEALTPGQRERYRRLQAEGNAQVLQRRESLQPYREAPGANNPR